MSKILRWIGIVVGSLLGLLVVAYTALYFASEERINKVYDVPEEHVVVPTDEAAIARGSHLVNTVGFCTECHGLDLGGSVMVDDPLLARLAAPNLTMGEGGKGRELSDADFVRAIRHGVAPDGRSLVVMPSPLFNELSDADLGSIVAYIRSVPPVDKEQPGIRVGPIGRFYIWSDPSSMSASTIDHNAPRPPAPEPGVTAEYGKYLAFNCRMCHGEDLSGMPPDEGGGPNLTLGGDLGSWTEAEFINTIRTRVKPDGEAIDPENAPIFTTIARMTDDELGAIWLYLQTVPSVANTPTPES